MQDSGFLEYEARSLGGVPPDVSKVHNAFIYNG